MRDKYILTAESVARGHLDKLCGAAADSGLDTCGLRKQVVAGGR